MSLIVCRRIGIIRASLAPVTDRDEKLRGRLAAVGGRLRELRVGRGWSQEELADQVGLHRTYVGSVERGERNIGIANVFALADALGVPASALLEEL